MILAVRVNLMWTHKDTENVRVMQEIIHGPMRKLHFDWAYEKSGPRLRGEILCELFSGEIKSDIEKLHKMGVRGNIVFGKSHCREYCFVKCVLEPYRIVWYGTNHIQTDNHLDI